MPWQDRLVQASFRGVPFGVDSNDIEHGRHVVQHKFIGVPGQCSEDFGLDAWAVQITAFVWGAEYLAAAQALWAALLAPGPGELILPRQGTRQCIVAERSKLRESADRGGGWAEFSLTFAEESGAPHAGQETNPVDRLDGAVGAARSAADGGLLTHLTQALTSGSLARDMAGGGAIKILTQIAGPLLGRLDPGWRGDVSAVAESAKGQIGLGLPDPGALTHRLSTLWRGIGDGIVGPDATRRLESQAHAAGRIDDAAAASLAAGDGLRARSGPAYQGADAPARLIRADQDRDLLLAVPAAASRPAALAPAERDGLAATGALARHAETHLLLARASIAVARAGQSPTDSRSILEQGRRGSIEAIDRAVVRAARARDHALAEYLLDVQPPLLAVLDAEIARAARLVTIQWPRAIPVCVLAHRAYGPDWVTEGRAAEIIALNAAAHTGALPPGPVHLLLPT